MEYIRGCLSALEYPHWEGIDLRNKSELVQLVSWLEDRKIRELEIGERAALRTPNECWDISMAGYLETLNCPYVWRSSEEIDCIAWLVSHAIALEYEDIADTYQDIEVETDQIDAIDSGDQSELGIKIDELGSLLEMRRTDGENDPDFLRRISRQASLYLSHGAQHFLLAGHSASELLPSFPLGFDTADALVNKASLVLKMLYLSEYRELQNDLNALIVLGQEYTANPRTNAVLGKVGR